MTCRRAVACPPACPYALTARVLIPGWSGIGVVVQAVVPLAWPPPPCELFHVTLSTPVESEAVPARMMVDAVVVYTGLLTGDLI